MNCTRCREALSATADGEDTGVRPEAVDRHLLACHGCRAFRAGLDGVTTAPRAEAWRGAEPDPELTSRVLARLDADGLIRARPAGTSARPRPPVSIWRIGLVALAIGQLAAAVPALAGASDTVALHASHDLGAVELALSACFLLAAFRPRRAGGFVPVLGAVVACLALVAVADVATGRIAATSELPHLVDALGLVMLVAVARRQTAPTLTPGIA